CASFAIAPETIYFGGGTPTALTTAQLEFLFEGLRQKLDLSFLEEWTIEANPGSVSTRKAALLCELGVTRISLGVQSWDNALLKLLGREHSAQQAEQSFRLLRTVGFSNINIDLMFGLPGQTIEQWRLTLQKTIALQPDHISAYCLTYEGDDNVAPGERRLRTLRNLKLRASRFFVSPQPCLLARQRLSGAWPQCGFDCRYAEVAECL
ncbi:MAG: hypothetical protein DMF28_00110, partial [Verrucomicrobia bacterium]